MSSVEKFAFCKFGLMVTGRGEARFLGGIFKSLCRRATCGFNDFIRIDQRAPISNAQRLRMVGSGKLIPDKDETQIGLRARHFLSEESCRFLILIDDLEHDRRDDVAAIYTRYRHALDTMLKPEDRPRASVHFFANMLEAYYFAHADAVNEALSLQILERDHEDDVETIRHPKNRLKELARAKGGSFDEMTDGEKIIPRLDLDRVLSRPDTCAYLRSLFGWCVRQLNASGHVTDSEFHQRYQLQKGVKAPITKDQ